jgi:hypothetical protein
VKSGVLGMCHSFFGKKTDGKLPSDARGNQKRGWGVFWWFRRSSEDGTTAPVR